MSAFLEWLGHVDSWADLWTVASWYPAEAALMVSVLVAVAGVLLIGAGFTGIAMWRRRDAETSIVPDDAPVLELVGVE